MRRQLCRFSALAAAFVSVHAHAQVVAGDDPALGQGTVTVDVAQGLEFLDLTYTDGLSVADVTPELGLGGAFEGWRLATLEEVQTLVNNWGFSPTVPVGALHSTLGDTGGDQVSGLVDLVGATYDSLSTLRWAGGFVDPASPGVNAPAFNIVDNTDPLTDDLVETPNVTAGANSLRGVWLVRTPAPGPVFQGRLTDGGAPVSGVYDLSLELIVDGALLAGPEVVSGVDIADGLFTIELPFDAGDLATGRSELRVSVDDGNSVTLLSPNLPVSPAPLADRAKLAQSLVGTNAVGAREANLRIVRGRVSSGGSATAGRDVGFTSSKSLPGRYDVVFDEAFGGVPVVTVTLEANTNRTVGYVSNLTATGCTVEVREFQFGQYADNAFNFVAIGTE